MKLCTVDQLEPNATIVVYYEVLQHDQLESNITKSVQSRTSNFDSSVKKKELERSYIYEVCSDMILNEMGGGEIPIHLFAHRLLFHSERIIGLFS